MTDKRGTLAALIAAAEGILLDFDGTLADSERAHFEANRETFRLYGHELDEREYFLWWTSRGAGIKGEIERHELLGIDVEFVRSHKDKLFEAMAAGGRIKLFPETPALVEAIAAARVPAAIATNSSDEQVRLILSTNGIADCGIPIIGGRPGVRAKPHPDLFLSAAQYLGLTPDACVVVEDTRKGLTAALAAGMRSILIDSDYLTIEDKRQAHAVCSLRELTEAVRERVALRRPDL